MATLPSDSAIKAYLEQTVHGAADLTQLSRTALKDGLQQYFQLSDESRAQLDEEDHYKRAIKAWTKEAVVSVCFCRRAQRVYKYLRMTSLKRNGDTLLPARRKRGRRQSLPQVIAQVRGAMQRRQMMATVATHQKSMRMSPKMS